MWYTQKPIYSTISNSQYLVLLTMVPRNSLFREQTEHSAASRGGAFSHPRTREEARLARPDPAFLCASPQTTPFYARVAQVFTPGGGSAPSGEAQTGQRKKTNDTQERATLIAGLMRKQKKHTHTHTERVETSGGTKTSSIRRRRRSTARS